MQIFATFHFQIRRRMNLLFLSHYNLNLIPWRLSVIYGIMGAVNANWMSMSKVCNQKHVANFHYSFEDSVCWIVLDHFLASNAFDIHSNIFFWTSWNTVTKNSSVDNERSIVAYAICNEAFNFWLVIRSLHQNPFFSIATKYLSCRHISRW